MSDTDDTDVLLVIPPDFFTVSTSDSEGSVYASRSVNCQYNGVERIHVKELLHQVHNLENRISLIENKDNISSDYFDRLSNLNLPHSTDYPLLSYQGEYNCKYLQESEKLRPSVGLDSVHVRGSVSCDSTPVKRRQVTNLPSNHHFNQASHLVQSRIKDSEASSYDSGAVLTDPLSLSTECSMEIHSVQNSGMPFSTSSDSALDRQMINKSSTDARISHSHHKTDLIREIDDFLENVKQNPQNLSHHKLITERHKKEKVYQCGDNVDSIPDLHFGLRDLSKLPVREPPAVTKYYAPLGPKPPSSVAHRLSLPEVNKLLEEMEATQMQMEQKLRMKEAQFGKGFSKSADSPISFPRQPTLCGDGVGSVPDLGFGIRDVMASQSTDSSQFSRKPAQEPKVIKRTMSLLGVNPNQQTLANSQAGVDGKETHEKNNVANPQDKTTYPDNVNTPKVSVPKRSQLGDDPGTIPELGFGLKNWYRSMDSSTNVAPTNNSVTTGRENSTHPSNKYIQGGLPSSIPNLGFGLRDLWTEDTTAQVAPVTHSNTESHKTDLGRGNFPVVQPDTNAQKGTTTEERYTQKVGYSTQSGPRDTVVLDQEYGAGKQKVVLSVKPQLPSLSGLWKEQVMASSLDSESDTNTLKHKLEEERYRRQHCEHIIQQLQIKLLEEQQKLAVAVQVDTEKDQAILHFQNAWSQHVNHWQELEEQRNSLALHVQVEKEQHQQHMTQSLQKIRNCETEMSKALDLAQGFKDKSDQIEREMHNLTERHRLEVQALHNELDEKEQDIGKVVSEKEDLWGKLKILEEDTKKDKNVLLTAKKELDKKSRVISGYEADVAALKEEKGTLQLTLRDEKSKSAVLEQHKKSLQTALDESKKKEKSFREEIKDASSRIEKLKVELRDFYQEQVEIVVRDKLREFQNQLDLAEKSLRGELENKEQAFNELATRQIKQISEKHQLEVKLLEEKHREELQLCQLKLAQAIEQITRLEIKLKSYNSRKGEIVEKLHGVMENHWHQALQIINGNSPLSSRPHPRLDANGRESNHEAWPVTSNGLLRDRGSSAKGMAEGLKHSQTNPPQLSLHNDILSTSDDIPFSKEGQTPQEKSSHKNFTEQDLKKYVEMLLNRSLAQPAVDNYLPTASDGQLQSSDGRGVKDKDMTLGSANQLPRWENIERLDSQTRQKKLDSQPPFTETIPEFDLSKLSHNSVSVETKSGKPPWK